MRTGKSEQSRHIERFKKTQGKIRITDEIDKIIDEPCCEVMRSALEPLDYHDLYWGERLSEAEILEKKLDMITEKINEIIDSVNRGV